MEQWKEFLPPTSSRIATSNYMSFLHHEQEASVVTATSMRNLAMEDKHEPEGRRYFLSQPHSGRIAISAHDFPWFDCASATAVVIA